MITASSACSARCVTADSGESCGAPVKLYIHVPFCRSKCAYCDFYSGGLMHLVPKWLEAVGREWEALRGDRAPETIYIGGGTPSVLAHEKLKRLIAFFPADGLREFTIEANPEDITPEWAAMIAGDTPVDRVSMGIQTFDNEALKFLGRRHTAERAEAAVTTLRREGIGNISCDLIYGLPGQTLADWTDNVNRLLELRPEHISAYLLSYEPRTRLGLMLKRGQVSEVSDTLAEEMYGRLCELTHAAGYEHYEISNFAMPGRRAIHNSSYWDGSDYIGLGQGAHSIVGGQRWSNPADVRAYVNSIPGEFREMEEESEASRFNDMIITSLRTAAGLNTARVPQQFAARFLNDAIKLIKRGDLHVEPTDSIARLTSETILSQPVTLTIPESRWLVADSILLHLIEDA